MSWASHFMVLHENLGKRMIYAGFSSLSDLTAAVAVAVGMWKPGPLRVSKLRGRAEPLWLTFHHSALGAPFPQRDPGLSAILARICCLATGGAEMGAFEKAA